MDAADFLRVLLPYMEAFVERDAARRMTLLEQSLASSVEIRGPTRIFTGYAEVDGKITAFQGNWPGCRLVLASGLNTFRNTCHFAMAIVDREMNPRASGHSVVELAPDGRIQRILAFWGAHAALPDTFPPEFRVKAPFHFL